MSKEKELVKNTAIISVGKICTQLVSFFLLPMYTAVLSTVEYGTVDLVITYSSLFLPFVTLALEQALFRFLIDVRSEKEKCSKYISTTVFVSFLFTTIAFLILLVIYFISYDALFIYFGLVLVGLTISSVSQQIARGLGDNIGYTLGSTISAIVQIILNIIFLVFFQFGAFGMMLSSFGGGIICGLILFFRCNLRQYIRCKYIDIIYLREMIRYSLPLIPNQLSWWALNASDKVIVQLFLGVAANGIIAVANKFSGVYIQFLNIFNISWTESVALHIKDKDAQVFISKTVNSVYRFFLCMCCMIITIIPFVFSILINEKYNLAYDLIPIFLFASLLNVVVSLYGVIYVAYKKTVEIAKTAIYAGILNVVSHLILVKFIGIYAAGISTMIGYGVMAIYRYFHSRRYIAIRFSKQTIIYSIILVFIAVSTYYCTNIWIHLFSLFTVLVITMLINKEMIFCILKWFKDELKHRKL